jgi:hypothetical protein
LETKREIWKQKQRLEVTSRRCSGNESSFLLCVFLADMMLPIKC